MNFTLYDWKNKPAGKPARLVPCEVYSRIVGYLRPTMNWNTGKRQEFAERTPYAYPREAAQ